MNIIPACLFHRVILQLRQDDQRKMLGKLQSNLVAMSLSLLPLPLHSPQDQRTSHDHSRVFDLRPDEIHTNHSSQIVHTHLVNSTVQLDFMEKPVGNQEIPE